MTYDETIPSAGPSRPAVHSPLLRAGRGIQGHARGQSGRPLANHRRTLLLPRLQGSGNRSRLERRAPQVPQPPQRPDVAPPALRSAQRHACRTARRARESIQQRRRGAQLVVEGRLSRPARPRTARGLSGHRLSHRRRPALPHSGRQHRLPGVRRFLCRIGRGQSGRRALRPAPLRRSDHRRTWQRRRPAHDSRALQQPVHQRATPRGLHQPQARQGPQRPEQAHGRVSGTQRSSALAEACHRTHEPGML